MIARFIVFLVLLFSPKISMDFLKAEIARKRKQVEESKVRLVKYFPTLFQ